MTGDTKSTRIPAIEVFYSYAHEDEALRKELEKHLASLQQQGFVAGWHDRMIGAGTEWEQQIDEHLNTAQIILLLISASFIASRYCYSIEMKRAMERHEAGEARVIPIILRPVYWQHTPFNILQALPTEGKPVDSSQWHNHDEAFANIVEGIHRVIEELVSTHTDHPDADHPDADHQKGLRASNTSTTTRAALPKPAQPTWNIPFERNPYFTGREDIITRLHTALDQENAAALAQAISGLGGIGKTQTAIEYAYRYLDNYWYIFWVKCDTRELLVCDFVGIANLLHLPEKDDQEQAIIIAAVKRWLAANTGWLLILDNADDVTMAKEFMPSPGKGHILLTTRAQILGRLAQRIEIEKMEGEEATLFLLRRASMIGSDGSLDDASPADIAGARAIVRAVDGLPLALDQAAAYIEETECGLTGYLQRFQTQRTLLLQQRGDLIADHPDPVATTWKLSFQKVEQADPVAADLLRLCAFLAPDAIPEEIIIEGADDLGPNLQPVASEPVKLDSAFKELRKYSLVRRDPHAQTFTIHRLVQAVLKDEMDEHTQRQWAERAVKAVNRVFPGVTFKQWPQCERYLPQALECETLIRHWNLAFSEAARLLNQAGFYLKGRGRYPEALPLYERALAIREQELGPHHPDTATSLNNLALLYKSQGKYREALPLYERALAIREQELGPHHPSTATSLNNLALLYKSQGKYAEALPLYERALAIDEQAYGPNHPDVATDLNNLAGLYHSQGKYAEALPLVKRALAIYEQALGSNHPDTATIRENYADLLKKVK